MKINSKTAHNCSEKDWKQNVMSYSVSSSFTTNRTYEFIDLDSFEIHNKTEETKNFAYINLFWVFSYSCKYELNVGFA